MLFETLNSQRFDCQVSLVMNAVKCVSDGMMILKLFMGSRMFNGQDCRNVFLIGGRGSFYESFFYHKFGTFCVTRILRKQM